VKTKLERKLSWRENQVRGKIKLKTKLSAWDAGNYSEDIKKINACFEWYPRTDLNRHDVTVEGF
jgi:hypothetical protein